MILSGYSLPRNSPQEQNTSLPHGCISLAPPGSLEVDLCVGSPGSHRGARLCGADPKALWASFSPPVKWVMAYVSHYGGFISALSADCGSVFRPCSLTVTFLWQLGQSLSVHLLPKSTFSPTQLLGTLVRTGTLDVDVAGQTMELHSVALSQSAHNYSFYDYRASSFPPAPLPFGQSP